VKKKIIYIHSVSLANILFVMLLKFKYRVIIWKTTCPDILVRRFEKLRPYNLFSWDEWMQIQDDAFDLWEQKVSKYLYHKFSFHTDIGNKNIDFSINMLQKLGQQFETLYLFLVLVHKHTGKFPAAVVSPWIADVVDCDRLKTLTGNLLILNSLWARSFEGLHEIAITLAYYTIMIFSFLRSLFIKRIRTKSGGIYWLGISGQEIPCADQRLNFAWASQYGLIQKDDILYFTPSIPNKNQSMYLTKKGVKWIVPLDIFRLIPVSARLHAITSATTSLLRILATSGFVAWLQAAQLIIRASVWAELVKFAKPRAYVTTTSYSWPERPELAVMKRYGVRSIIWAYSANSLQFSINNPHFRDVGIMRSIILADEFWVWNDAYRNWLQKRQISIDWQKPKFRVIGPMMCGNSEWLRHKAAAKRKIGLPDKGFCIGVFDMPAVNHVWRDRFGGGPGIIEPEDYKEFCAGIQTLLKRIPECYALIKMKRYLNDIYRDFPVTLHELIDADGPFVSAGKVFLADINIDPFLPVAASDIAIGMTFTSPVLAVRSMGRPGWYFDPRKRANYPSHLGLKDITIQSIEELVQIVSRSVAGESLPQPSTLMEEVTPPTMNFPKL